MMGITGSTNSVLAFKDIKQLYEKSYQCIDEAIKLEEQERPIEAIEKYKEGILLIDQALGIQIECPDNPDHTWEKGRHMIQQMKQIRGELLTRINCVQISGSYIEQIEERDQRESPPSYAEAISRNPTLTNSTTGSDNQPVTYNDLAMALRNLAISTADDSLINIIYTHDDVRLYFITPESDVTSATDYLTLKIGILEGILPGEKSTTFLIVGEWVYPLVPGVSPCYHTEYGAFILPDVHSDVPGSSVGIILPCGDDSELYYMLEDILHGVLGEKPSIISDIEQSDPKRRKRQGQSITGYLYQGLTSGAEFLSKNLIQGAMKTGDLINQGTPHLLNYIQPAEQPQQVNRKVERGLEVASNVTGAAASVSGIVAGKLGVATMALGRFLAPHVARQGTRLLANQFNMTEDQASQKVNNVLTLAAGAVESFATVYSGLETSAKVLGRNISDNTVKIVEHKYGPQSGRVAENTLNTLGNVVTTTHNINFITPKGLAKQSVKATGKALIEDVKESESNQNRQKLYPELPKEPLPGCSKTLTDDELITESLPNGRNESLQNGRNEQNDSLLNDQNQTSNGQNESLPKRKPGPSKMFLDGDCITVSSDDDPLPCTSEMTDIVKKSEMTDC